MKLQRRGSRKHVLELLDSGRFCESMSGLLDSYGVTIRQTDAWRPLGSVDEEEWDLRRFCAEYVRLDMDFARLDTWWVPSNFRNPQWDLLSTCEIEGRPGLLLVEAKANDHELDWKGKPKPKASSQSQENHAIIGRCIEEANAALNTLLQGFSISRDSHYQLSNRIASAWKLAQCGLHVVLLYLGFLGDTGVANVGEPFIDQVHWQRIMGGYMQGIAPLHFPGRVLRESSGGTLRMVIESMPVLNVSEFQPAQQVTGGRIDKPRKQKSNTYSKIIVFDHQTEDEYLIYDADLQEKDSDLVLFNATKGKFEEYLRRQFKTLPISAYSKKRQEALDLYEHVKDMLDVEMKQLNTGNNFPRCCESLNRIIQQSKIFDRPGCITTLDPWRK